MGVGRVFFDGLDSGRNSDMWFKMPKLSEKTEFQPYKPWNIHEMSSSKWLPVEPVPMSRQRDATQYLMSRLNGMDPMSSGSHRNWLDATKSWEWLKIKSEALDNAHNKLQITRSNIDLSQYSLEELRRNRLVTKFISLGQADKAEVYANEYMAKNKTRGDTLRSDINITKEERKVAYKKWFAEFAHDKWISIPTVSSVESVSAPPADTPWDPQIDPKDFSSKQNPDAAAEEFYDKEEEQIQKLREAQVEHVRAEQEYVTKEQEYTQYVQSQDPNEVIKGESNWSEPVVENAIMSTDSPGVHPIGEVTKGMNLTDSEWDAWSAAQVRIWPDGSYTFVDTDSGRVWDAPNKEVFQDMYGYYLALGKPLEGIQNMGEEWAMTAIKVLQKSWSQKTNSEPTPKSIRRMVMLAISREIAWDQGEPMQVTLSDIHSGWAQYESIIKRPLSDWDNMVRFTIAAKEKWFFSEAGIPNMNKIFDAVAKISG
jgi:hypothetical protein